MNRINLNQILITEYKETFKIKYTTTNFQLSGLSVAITNFQLIKDNYTYRLVFDDKTLRKLQEIDTYLLSKIDNYKPFLTSREGDPCIILDANGHIGSLYKKGPNKVSNKLILTIKYIKKNNLNTPIIHINE